jgi:F1F0 ATPase subunit 2
MSWTTALTAGAGLGLLHFSGLWLTVRACLRPGLRRLILPGQAARLALCAVVFWALAQDGAAALLLGLAGFWLARSCLLVRLGGTCHG